MASTTVRVAFPASRPCLRVKASQREESTARRRPILVDLGSSLNCRIRWTCPAPAGGNMARPVRLRGRPAKLACTDLNSVEQKGGLLEGGEELSNALAQLRQAVEQRGGDVKSADDMEMLRFLRGKSMDIEKAATAFVRHQTWRSEFVPKGGFADAAFTTELDSQKSYWIEKDKRGRPVILTIGRKHLYNKDVNEFTRFLVYTLDKAIAGAPPGTEGLLTIVDLKGLGVKNLDTKSFITAFDLLQNHYPGRIEKMFMINVPLLFNGLWKVVNKFLEEGTKKKIIFVDNKKLTETLLEDIDIQYLPKEYGGNADLLLLHDAKISNGHGVGS